MKGFTITFLLLTVSTAFGAGSKLDAATGQQKANISKAQKSQSRVEKIDDKRQTLLDEYRMVLRQIENTQVYNEQLRGFIKSQNTEMGSIVTQIDSLKETSRAVVPMMIRMINNLESFVKLDVPFLEEERQKRIAELRKTMGRADVSTSEKYRRILEAYQTENDYGRTIEAYRGIIKNGLIERTVDFLRIGRVSLIYQTLDGSDTQVWDSSSKRWQDANDFHKSVRKGLRIARKQLAPNLMTMPILKGAGQ